MDRGRREMDGFDMLSPSWLLLLLLLLLSLGFLSRDSSASPEKGARETRRGGRVEKKRETVKLQIYITGTQGETHKKSGCVMGNQVPHTKTQQPKSHMAHYNKCQERITSKYQNITTGKLSISSIFLKPNLDI